jgi:hypothetical protein
MLKPNSFSIYLYNGSPNCVALAAQGKKTNVVLSGLKLMNLLFLKSCGALSKLLLDFYKYRNNLIKRSVWS